MFDRYLCCRPGAHRLYALPCWSMDRIHLVDHHHELHSHGVHRRELLSREWHHAALPRRDVQHEGVGDVSGVHRSREVDAARDRSNKLLSVVPRWVLLPWRRTYRSVPRRHLHQQQRAPRPVRLSAVVLQCRVLLSRGRHDVSVPCWKVRSAVRSTVVSSLSPHHHNNRTGPNGVRSVQQRLPLRWRRRNVPMPQWIVQLWW